MNLNVVKCTIAESLIRFVIASFVGWISVSASTSLSRSPLDIVDRNVSYLNIFWWMRVAYPPYSADSL